MITPELAPFAGLTAVFCVLVSALGVRVSLRRVALGGLTFGDGQDDQLRRRIRIHGNFVEYAPTALAAVLAIGLAGGPVRLGWGLAAAFLAARLLHAWALGDDRRTAARGGAMALLHLTFLTAAAAIAWLLIR